MSIAQLKSASSAFVFPGQGSQSLGMLSELSQEFFIIKETFKEASAVLGYDLWLLTQIGPENQLNQTQFTQPALLAADVAVWRCFQSQCDINPILLAGHSLGEYSALVCAEALAFTDAIDLVSKRGLYMQEAVAEGIGAMGAIVGLSNEMVRNICIEVSDCCNQIVSPANLNGVTQIVIAGHAEAVDEALKKASMLRAKIAKRIAVSVPSHCPLMQPAADKLAKDLKKVHINKSKIKVIHNVDVQSYEESDAIKLALINQLVYPVRWVETIQNIVNVGVEVVIECGPGRVLTGLNKRITNEFESYPAADLMQFSTALNALRGVTICP